ncbi:uncharacterized protein A4U43_C02F5880 [Asparagus officinalis]|uniref:Sucrose-phosphate synthase n=1 Tax=Asparagus officinalis TaxID=4686 RepID=A0A5P1FG82_ASPOF|nr:uncharacterized protein A4U43_C02F5880 [Asparagus officinalis]
MLLFTSLQSFSDVSCSFWKATFTHAIMYSPKGQMAGNEWINGYLEAILDAAGSKKHPFSYSSSEHATAVVTPSRYSPTQYFVEEVVNHFDDSDLYKTWTKKRLESRDLGYEDLSELSEGEREKAVVDSPRNGGVIPRISSELEVWSGEDGAEAKRLYIVLISLHGLVRGENMELGRDSDTGGQVKYVVELARALAATKGVYRVDLLTRQISSPDVDRTYGEPVEMLTHTMDEDAYANVDGCGAYIIRLPCGPRDRYIHKEALWPHIPEFIDRALAHITNVARSLAEHQADSTAGYSKPTWPYIIHGHYADAAEVAAHLSGLLNVPMVMTGHSLGRNKLEQLVKQGRLTRGEVNSTYRIARRIEAEELGLDSAEMVVTSTRQEIEEQWGLYDGFDVRLERKLRVRRRRGVSCLGRYMPRMVVIPPGMDFSYVNMQELTEGDGDLSSFLGSERSQNKRDLPPIWSEILRFFTNPHKPMILALSRPDPKKNVTTLLKAFGGCRGLRELANLTLILGNRDDIEEMHGSSTAVLTAVLKLIDKYDLYGHVAYPKHHKQGDVPEIYRLAAKTKGVFINPALVEPFGLTLIEAAAYGLPVVATKNGGPVDILKALNNGVLVDPHDPDAISEALLKLVSNKSLWLECRKNGLKNIHLFSWPEHCRNYLSNAELCRMRHPSTAINLTPRVEEPMSDSLQNIDDLSIQFSIDGADINTALLEAFHRRNPQPVDYCSSPCRRQNIYVIATDCYDSNGEILMCDLSSVIGEVMRACGQDGHNGFVFSTGCTIGEAIEALRCCKVEPGAFDALICSSGSEVYYPWKDLITDEDYSAHLEYRWSGEHVKSSVMRFAKIDGAIEEDSLIVDEGAGSCHCYAYSLRPGAKARKVDAIRQNLRMRGFRCNLICTRACTRLNIIPLFASRAHALRYLSIRWGFDLSKVTIFVGEKGDTDLEELLPGVHKTIILRDFVRYGSERHLRDEESYEREDVVPVDSPNIASLAEGCDASDISSVIERIGGKL